MLFTNAKWLILTSIIRIFNNIIGCLYKLLSFHDEFYFVSRFIQGDVRVHVFQIFFYPWLTEQGFFLLLGLFFLRFWTLVTLPGVTNSRRVELWLFSSAQFSLLFASWGIGIGRCLGAASDITRRVGGRVRETLESLLWQLAMWDVELSQIEVNSFL